MKHVQSWRAAAAAGWLAAGLGGAAADEAAPPCGRSAVEIHAAARHGVVRVASVAIDPYRLDQRVRFSTGSGLVLADGTVATNHHVVADARQIAVYMGETPFPAVAPGMDPDLDLALLATDAAPSDAALPFAPDAPPPIGSKVYALGFPLGIGEAMSAGIISGHDRVVGATTLSWLTPMLQTDAAISPGNSGGPLLDDCGRVVGLVSSKITAPGAEGLGFAIPVEVLRPALEELSRTGRIARPWHGLYGQMATPLIRAISGLAGTPGPAGFLVETVEPGSAADRAGIRGGTWPVLWGQAPIILNGDVIIEVDGRPIDAWSDVYAAVGALKIGHPARVTFLRNGERREVEVVLDERPPSPVRPGGPRLSEEETDERP